MLSMFNKLLKAQNDFYKVCGFRSTDLMREAESAEYYAHYYNISNKSVKFRIAKITPTKSGQFVTMWKRGEDGIIKPYDQSDNIDFFVINVAYEDKIGQFVFPQATLIAKNIFSLNDKGGKRAIRVYSPWDKVSSRQALLTQKWQMQYFIEITPDTTINVELAKKLYSISK